MGITEASYTMIISKFNTTAFMKKDNQWTELIEYLENLHALDATDKKSEAQKKANNMSETKTKSKSKGHWTGSKGKKSTKKREIHTNPEISSHFCCHLSVQRYDDILNLLLLYDDLIWYNTRYLSY